MVEERQKLRKGGRNSKGMAKLDEQVGGMQKVIC